MSSDATQKGDKDALVEARRKEIEAKKAAQAIKGSVYYRVTVKVRWGTSCTCRFSLVRSTLYDIASIAKGLCLTCTVS